MKKYRYELCVVHRVSCLANSPDEAAEIGAALHDPEPSVSVMLEEPNPGFHELPESKAVCGPRFQH